MFQTLRLQSHFTVLMESQMSPNTLPISSSTKKRSLLNHFEKTATSLRAFLTASFPYLYRPHHLFHVLRVCQTPWVSLQHYQITQLRGLTPDHFKDITPGGRLIFIA